MVKTMSGTRRRPIDRPPRPIIDAESVRLFRRGTRFVEEGREEDKEFKRLAMELHRRLGLKPWHQNIFDLDDSPPVDHHYFRGWKWVASLRDQLGALAWPRPRLVSDEERRDEADDAHQPEPPP